MKKLVGFLFLSIINTLISMPHTTKNLKASSNQSSGINSDHKKKQKSPLKKIGTAQKFTCYYDNCTKSFATPFLLNKHIRNIHNEERIKCPYHNCTKSFVNKKNLDNHIKRFHTPSIDNIIASLPQELLATLSIVNNHYARHSYQNDQPQSTSSIKNISESIYNISTASENLEKKASYNTLSCISNNTKNTFESAYSLLDNFNRALSTNNTYQAQVLLENASYSTIEYLKSSLLQSISITRKPELLDYIFNKEKDSSEYSFTLNNFLEEISEKDFTTNILKILDTKLSLER